MKSYRCYFTDEADRIRSYEQIECVDDGAAALKVDELLATSRYGSAELWEGARLVGKWSFDGHNIQGQPPIALTMARGM